MTVSKWMRGASIAAMAAVFAATPGFAADAHHHDQHKVEKQSAEAAKAALQKLFADADEAHLKLNPIEALFRGDMRYADQFGDYISDDFLAKTKANKESALKRLKAIDRNTLSSTDKIAYDVFRYQTEQDLEGARLGIDRIGAETPISHFFGFHVFFPDISSGRGAAPYKTVADYENGLKRIDGFVSLLDRSIARMREGMKNGHTQPRLVMENVIGQLDNLIKQGVDDSTYYAPVKNLPADMAQADKDRLTTAYRDAIGNKIQPAHKRMRDFIANEYLAACRDKTPGLLSMKDGAKVYAFLVEQNTTTKMTPEEIHKLGLSEVDRITKEMEAIKAKVGFKGNLREFFEFIRTDPQFTFKSKQDMIDAYNGVRARAEAAIPKLFSLTPKTPFEIRPVPEYREKNEAGGSYQPGAPDGSRPGVFYINTYDLPSRSTTGMETLFLHEAEPGHHFQISLAQENADLPNFMRFGGNTAYAEGWGLYAESLWQELGMETDPYQRFGGLTNEMLRAMRLVVDTGIHAKGWSRDQGIQYMLDHSAMSKTDVTAEVERYVAIPGQALAYKVGALTIRRLRTEAEKELGPKFDVRGFHAQVLNTGALPMAVLESKVRDWVKAEKTKA